MRLTIRSLIVPACLAVLIWPAAAETISGRARAVDGDTLSIGAERVRLFGVDAPEMDQMCDRDGRLWACGAMARDMLADLVAAGRLGCDVVDTDRYGRAVAVCALGEQDVGAQMVRQGGAIAYRRYSERYVNAETAARREGLGIWTSVMLSPEDHRHAGDEPNPVPKAAQASDCAIKGNVSGSGKQIYHLPGQADYAATRINTGKGERWFCSEAEARAAGFRRAKR
jgi:endonuclease YncB( thermonuclease family)